MKAKAFYMMYLTLMLILVSFLVGSFVRKAVAQKPKAAPQAKSLEHKNPPETVSQPSDSFTLAGIFISDSETSSERIDALATVLNQHDITAELIVYSVGPEAMFEGALGRSATLLRELLKRGVKMDSVHAFASVEKVGGDIEVRLFHAV